MTEACFGEHQVLEKQLVGLVQRPGTTWDNQRRGIHQFYRENEVIGRRLTWERGALPSGNYMVSVEVPDMVGHDCMPFGDLSSVTSSGGKSRIAPQAKVRIIATWLGPKKQAYLGSLAISQPKTDVLLQ